MSTITTQLVDIEQTLKAMLPPSNNRDAFRKQAEQENVGQVAGTLYSIQECARILQTLLDVKLDVVGDTTIM